MLTTQKFQHSHTAIILILLCVLTFLCFGFSLCVGSVHLNLNSIYQALHHQGSPITQTIVMKLRLPRTLAALVTGGLLALSGALMQTLLRNPLADPYVLGISGGAAVATLLGLLLGITAYTNLWAFAGALLTMLLVMSLAQLHKQFSSLRLLLTGVVIATGWSALISFILTISPEQNLKSMLFWLMGDLSFAHFQWWQLLLLFLGTFVSFLFAKPLNILSRGDMVAKSLGVNTRYLNLLLYMLSALLTAVAVSIAGCIGFVGLIVPHMLRLLGGSDHRFVLIGSVLLGGSLLMVADTLARSLFSPTQLPVGIVTAIIGVPIFLFLLIKGYRRS